MLGLYRRYKERKEAERQQQQERQRKAHERKEQALLTAKQNMLSKPCAINDMNKCIEECVHFQNGYLYHFPDLIGGPMMELIEYPKCKMWRE